MRRTAVATRAALASCEGRRVCIVNTFSSFSSSSSSSSPPPPPKYASPSQQASPFTAAASHLTLPWYDQPHREAGAVARRHLSSRERDSDRIRVFREYAKEKSPYDDFDISKCKLGSGGFGDVYAATCKKTGVEAAVKIQNFDRNPWCHRELEMQSRVVHTNCTPILGAYVNARQLYIVTPKWHVDLYDYLVNEDERRRSARRRRLVSWSRSGWRGSVPSCWLCAS